VGIALAAAFAGYLLIYAGLKGVHPWCPVVTAFGGTCPPPPGSTSVLSTGTTRGATAVAPPLVGGHVGQGGASGPGGLTERAQAFLDAVRQRFPGAVYQGGFQCRPIIPHNGGTSDEWSEHAWGNAVDIDGPDEGTEQAIMAFAESNRFVFGVNNVIGPGSAVPSVHVDFLPSHAGQVPPCAGAA
jgi:hypothetical protein